MDGHPFEYFFGDSFSRLFRCEVYRWQCSTNDSQHVGIGFRTIRLASCHRFGRVRRALHNITGFSTIEPDRTIEWDDEFPHGSKAGEATQEDYDNWRKWWLYLQGAGWVLQHSDSYEFYKHFRENTGTPKTFDYEKAYRDDAVIRNNINSDLNASLQAANEAVMAGKTDVTLYSPKHSVGSPATENWQRTIGGHTMYTDTDVTVEGDTVTATVTVYARDKWNFNRDAHDLGSGTPDAVNGRFEELGWAKSFESSGSVTRTYTWKVGEQPPTLDTHTTESNESRKTKDYERYKP